MVGGISQYSYKGSFQLVQVDSVQFGDSSSVSRIGVGVQICTDLGVGLDAGEEPNENKMQPRTR